MSPRIRLAAEFDGVGQLTGAGTAVMLGVSVRALFDALGDSRDANDLPQKWKHLGRQRASEARAHCDSEHPVDLVHYWAVRQWGARVTVHHDTDAAEMWLTTDDPEVTEWFSLADGARQ